MNVTNKIVDLFRDAARQALDETIREMLGLDADAEEANDWQLPPGTEWAIVRSGKTTERWRTRYVTFPPWDVSPFYDHAARFETREEAETYIEGHGLTDCQPWPVPLS